jgi:hypothetical protein
MTNPTCTTCGSTSFALAEDSTEYVSVEWDGNEWLCMYDSGEPRVTGQRFFCTSCCTQHPVPEALRHE